MKKPAKPASPKAAKAVPKADPASRQRSMVLRPASQTVPVQWRWHYRVLMKLHSQLLRDRGSLLEDAAEPLEPHSLNDADSATDESDHDLILSRLAAESDALTEVMAALHRVFANTYGVCEESGRRIPPDRLKAIPWARYTREVEERLEKAGKLRRPGLSAPPSFRRGAQLFLVPEETPEGPPESRPTASDEAVPVAPAPPPPPPDRETPGPESPSSPTAAPANEAADAKTQTFPPHGSYAARRKTRSRSDPPGPT